MGTIAELLGFDLSEEDPESDAAAVVDGQHGIDEDDGARVADPVVEAVNAAIAEETGSEPDQVLADSMLVADLDLDALGRYAIVTTVERSLKISLRDEDVDRAETAGDLVDLARTAGGSRARR